MLILISKTIDYLNKKSNLLILIWIIILSILYSALSILRHNHFQSGAFDLGIYDQTIWQYAHLLNPYNTIKERFILGDHLSLTLPLIAPLYYIWDNVRIILVFQAVFVSLSALPIYLLCKNRGFSALISLSLSFIYSLFYGIQYLVFFDFHPIAIGVGLLAWFLYFFETGRKKLYLITLTLALLTQENMGIALASIGFIYLFKKERRKRGLFFIVFGFLISFIMIKIVAIFSPVGYQYNPTANLSPQSIIQSFFDSPGKREVWFYSLGWFSFLPLFSPGAMLAVIVDLSQYFAASKDFTWMQGPSLHHRGILAIFLLLGVLDVLEILKKRKINILFISIVLVSISLFLQYFFHFPLNKLSKAIYWQNESWMTDNNNLFRLIPKNASVATSQNLVPQLSHRKEIYLIYPRNIALKNNICEKKTCWWLEFAGKPEYLVVDLHPKQWVTQLLESNENFNEAVNNMEKAGKIKLVKNVNYVKLYKINYQF